MEWLTKHLATAAKIIAWLNLKKVFLLGTIAFGAIALYTAYEQRARIISVVTHQEKAKFAVSTEMQDRIKVLVMNSALIMTVTVLSADLKVNERDIVYRFSDSAVLNELWEKQFREHGSAQPIFTKDSENNSQMVSVVNGEFSCHPFSKTVNQQLVPDAGKLTAMICRISLPPYYGEFSGYLTFSLARVPSDLELYTIQLEAKKMANEIFFKNIVSR